MRLTFVTPAWGRYAVTHLALAQRRWLCDELALRGITADCIVVADDGNLEIAREYGFQTLERPNLLGYKLNSGIRMALDQESDYVAFVGSDDWMHPDLFNTRLMDGRAVISGRKMCLYDLGTGQSKVVTARSLYGVIPWLMPASLLEGRRWVPDHQETGLDIHLGLALDGCEWHHHDPHPLARVDFKSTVGLTPYGAGLGTPAPPLSDKYPDALVALVDEACQLVAA